MGEHIDQLAENLARGMSRRKALGLFIGGVAGLSVGGRVVLADPHVRQRDPCAAICGANYPLGSVAYAECLSACSPCSAPGNCPGGTHCVTIEVCSGGGFGGSGSGGFGGSGSGSGSGGCLPIDICAAPPR